MRRRRIVHLIVASVGESVVVIRVLKVVANAVATHAVKSAAMVVVVIAVIDPKLL
jgi:hypothetical protein